MTAWDDMVERADGSVVSLNQPLCAEQARARLVDAAAEQYDPHPIPSQLQDSVNSAFEPYEHHTNGVEGTHAPLPSYELYGVGSVHNDWDFWLDAL